VRGSYALSIVVLSGLILGCGKSSSRRDPPGRVGGAAGTTGGSAGTGGGEAGGGGDAPGGSSGSAGNGGTSGSSTGGTAGATEPGTELSLEGSPIYTRVQRLTNAQWERAVTDILRLDAPANLSRDFQEPVAGSTDFTNNEKLLYVDHPTALDLELAAEAAAALATGSPEALAALYAGTDAAGLVRTFGRRAFRRPLTDAEETRYQAIFTLGEDLYGTGFANGASLVVRAMLQSPSFLYRTELGADGAPLSSHEIASKLSFWLLGTTPSDALLDAADQGELAEADAVEAIARDMLEQPAARAVMRDFHGQLFSLARYRSVAKPNVPEFSDALKAELEEASHLFFERIFSEGLGWREVLTANDGFIGPALAPLYAADPPAVGFELRGFGPARAGYFMQVPFLLLNGVDRASDPVQRGVVVAREVLCAAPDTELTDPLGYAFERFDGMGQERELDSGVDTAGSYPFADGVKEFADAQELMQIFAETQQTHACYSKKVVGYALQRDIVETDRPLLDALAGVSSGEAVKELMVALARDPAFRLRQASTP
jgi:hypothetical protein